MTQELIVYMVRHGETDANVKDIIQGQTDVPLNSCGLSQAEYVGKRLGKMHFDAIYSSDLSRAAVTAGAIANGREIIFTPELREWNLGHWQSKYISEVAEKYPEEYHLFKSNSPDFTPAGGESLMEFRRRAASFLAKIAENHQTGTICCVTHGGFLRATLLNIMGMERYPVKARTDNTSVSCFKSFDGGRNWQLVLWNDSSHLTGELISSSGW